MVTHFICLTLGCLQDDKVTVSHWITAECTEPIITLAVGLSTACAGKQAPAIRGCLPPLSECLCWPWEVTASLLASALLGLQASGAHLTLPGQGHGPHPGFVQNPLTQTEGEAATVGVPPGGVLVTDHVNLEDPYLYTAHV